MEEGKNVVEWREEVVLSCGSVDVSLDSVRSKIALAGGATWQDPPPTTVLPVHTRTRTQTARRHDPTGTLLY
jgi:hypothetical protein